VRSRVLKLTVQRCEEPGQRACPLPSLYHQIFGAVVAVDIDALNAALRLLGVPDHHDLVALLATPQEVYSRSVNASDLNDRPASLSRPHRPARVIHSVSWACAVLSSDPIIR